MLAAATEEETQIRRSKVKHIRTNTGLFDKVLNALTTKRVVRKAPEENARGKTG
jgi:hypothetical protein